MIYQDIPLDDIYEDYYDKQLHGGSEEQKKEEQQQSAHVSAARLKLTPPVRIPLTNQSIIDN